MAKPKVTLGSLIDAMSDIREQRRAIDAQDKLLSKDYSTLELQLLALMDAEGVSTSTGHRATASISVTRQFNTVDWDAFFTYAAKLKRADLVQRRVSAPAVRELWQLKGTVPGLTPYDKQEISLRNL